MMESDITIAQKAAIKHINDIAAQLGAGEEYLELYGNYKAKIHPTIWPTIEGNSNGKLILVTATNPTSAGEGKTTVGIGLGDALNRLGYKTCVALREPSIGPCFGIKGGAAGGGLAQVVPMEDINLHFTGDIHAVTTAHNLLAAMIDNHIYHGNELNFDLDQIVWKRVMDINDRALRNILIGLGNKTDGVVRKSGFDITAASEIMAILCVSVDMMDLKRRIDKIIVGYDVKDAPVTCGKLKATGALAALLKDALKPNLAQTIGGTPALIHGGPFANIAHGCNSVVATKYALKLADYVVSEAGFGADLGAEKFLDIKCPLLGKYPDAVVIVSSIRALKLHAAGASVQGEGRDDLTSGFENLQKHVENMRRYNLPTVVALNVFSGDTPEEIERVRNLCAVQGVKFAVSAIWSHGAAGGIELSQAVLEAVNSNRGEFVPLYNSADTASEKLHKLATVICGADGISYTAEAENALKKIEKDPEANKYPICMAKTQYSLSDDKKLLGRPRGFSITVKKIKIMAGAEFIAAYAGDVVTMPGLPKCPTAEFIDVDEKITGLF
ncbi:MAG: formate--tetrahydrofolate ligase [Holosporaceae bacterium]|jgi:formate--tetrahydrofolate ligase|nr:formate--tetrahydrofolate ligase [Holosporaceae bacterium]